MKAPLSQGVLLVACLFWASSNTCAALYPQRSLATVHAQRRQHSKKHETEAHDAHEAHNTSSDASPSGATHNTSSDASPSGATHNASSDATPSGATHNTSSDTTPSGPSGADVVESTSLSVSSDDKLQEALKLAHKPDGPSGRVVMMVTVQEYMARMHLPIFLQSLKQAGDFHKHVVVVTFDVAAQRVCQQVHIPQLCVPEVVEEEINGKRMDDLKDEHGHKSTKWLVGWMKTKLTQRALFSGYDCVFTDIDMVFFKDPFKAIDWQADVAVTNDCEDGYHPKWDKREHAMGNLGLTYFKNNDNAKAVLTEWLGRAGPDTWDQWELKMTLEHQSEVNPTLWIQMLEREQWGNFCCDYCNKLVDMVVGRYKGWMEWCPLEQRQGWIMFHVACIKSHWGYGQDDHDETLEKRDAMLAIWEAGMQDRDNHFFNPEVHNQQM